MRKSLAGPAAAVALALGIGTAAPAVAADDPTPARQGASWLAGQLTHGLIHNTQFGGFDDYGLTADTGLELATVGGHPTAVHAVRSALAAHVTDYVSYPSGTGTHTSAGSLAKLLVVAQATGANPAAFGGHNLVGELSALVSKSAPTSGRIEDQLGEGDTDPTTDGDQPDTDFANVLGQALAARGLGNAHAADAAGVLAFLLKQQCPAGWFRINFTGDKTSATQGCSSADKADTDATSYAVIQLAALHTRTASVNAAIARARSWLRAHQHSGGAWGGGAGTTAVNANSTGLAAWALGSSAASRKAAIWLRRHQARDAGTCRTPLARDKGAVAYDDTARTEGRAHGISAASRDQWRRATAQVLVALRYAPSASGRLRVTSASRVKGHHAVRLSVHGTAPWSAVCAVRGSAHTQAYAGPAGGAHPVVKLASGSPSGTIKLVDSDGHTARYAVRLVGAHHVSVHRKH